MPLTQEEKIRRHYKSLRRSYYRDPGWSDAGTAIWLRLARTWKMPIREIKEIVKGS